MALRLKNVLPSIISTNQTAYVNKRCISESGRLISDILEICDKQKIGGFLVTMDIEKAFDSLDRNFLLTVLAKFGFGNNFLSWIKILIKKQLSCVINGGFTTSYFNLEKGARQGGPASAYLFILALEVLFISIKNNQNIKGLQIFKHEFLYTAYADDSTFFLKNIKSVKELIKSFERFYPFSGLKSNIDKCELAGIGSLKGVKKAICGLKCVDLLNDTIKILSIHFSYNKSAQIQNDFLTTVKKIQQVLQIWISQSLTLEGKIIIFKTLAISKIVYLALIITMPNAIIVKHEKIQKTFLWRNSHVKIKHQTLCNSFETGGLKNVDKNVKTTSLLCSWVQKLYNNNFHEWKIIPLHLIVKNFGNKFNFHSNLSFNKDLIDDFPLFYKNIFNFWSKHLSFSPELPSLILSNYLWYNNDILINKKPVYFPYFSEKNINHIAHLFDNFGKVKDWNVLKEEFHLDNKFYFQWMQLINAIPSKWKKIIKDEGKCENLLLLNHHLIKHNNLVCL